MRLAPSLSTLIAAVALASAAGAQPALGIVDNPCPSPLVRPTDANRDSPAATAYVAELERRARTDWGGLCRYDADSASLKAAAGQRPIAVFMGDSITELWVRTDAGFFTANGYVGRGISGQVSGQNLLRFQKDVVALKPKVVHIMIGTNDVAGNQGPSTYEDVQRNLTAMVQLARANGIAVVLATIPPAADFPWRKGMEPAPKIARLNAWIRDYAKRERLVVADYHSALDDGHGGFHPGWAADGVHPNAQGYQAMEPITLAAIRKAAATAR